jgi:hypothetical protein
MRVALWIAGVVLATAFATGCGGSQASSANLQPGKMPAGGNFDGVFQSPAYGRMEFTVDGNRAVGLYEGERNYGRIEGTIQGDVMLLHWTQWTADMQGKVRETRGRGFFRYTIEIDAGSTVTREVHRLNGEWGYGEDETGNVWNAVKLSVRAKKQLKPFDPKSVGSGMDEEYGASGFDESADAPGETEVEMSEPKAKEKEEDEGGGVDDLFD